MEVVCDPSASAGIIAISERFGVNARVVGRTEHWPGDVSLVIALPGETVEYARSEAK
jgi:hypothetical protein